MKCKDCKFWKAREVREDQSPKGECRIKSPAQYNRGFVFDASRIEAAQASLLFEQGYALLANYHPNTMTPMASVGWPFTKPDDWCGEWQGK